MLMGAIAGAEMAMPDVGIKVAPGSGVGAASNYWRSHEPRMPNQETRDSPGSRMDIHEYHASDQRSRWLWRAHPAGGRWPTVPTRHRSSPRELCAFHWAVKAQIHSGARGKVSVESWLCKTYHEVREAANGMLGVRSS